MASKTSRKAAQAGARHRKGAAPANDSMGRFSPIGQGKRARVYRFGGAGVAQVELLSPEFTAEVVELAQQVSAEAIIYQLETLAETYPSSDWPAAVDAAIAAIAEAADEPEAA